ncbi:MAG TPA: type II/IV secretion system ATPase subunit [Candidatus Thermoplasmatota archaeon]|nr:type II/IV secretion system ATPase subunit [Candidatus Thermoplasmatota archaeon]
MSAQEDLDLDSLLSRLEDELDATPRPAAPDEVRPREGPAPWDLVEGEARLQREEHRFGGALVRIIEDAGTKSLHYEVTEPELTPEELGMLRFFEDTLTATLKGYPDFDTIDAKRAFLEQAVTQIARDYRLKIAPETLERVTYYVERDFLGFGPIDVLMRDPMLEDVSCDGADIPLFVFHRRLGSLRTNIRFHDDETLDSFILRMAQASGKQITVASPVLDATLPDRSRLQATLAREVTPRGSSFTIRRFRDRPVSPTELLSWGTVSPVIAAYYWLLVEEGRSHLLAGGTASGKTTSLNAWSLFIPQEKKIVSIEDTREINIPHDNWIAGVARQGFGESHAGGKPSGTIDTFKLLEAALRQRPEYILVGEVRGAEAFTLFQAMATGHATYSTMHADSAYSAVRRLENPPISVPRIMIAGLDCLSVQMQTRVNGKAVRRVKEVVEFLGTDNESGELLTNTLFRWDPRTDRWVHGIKSYVIERIAEARGLQASDINKEWQRRAVLLDSLQRAGVIDYREVARAVTAYRAFPEQTYERIVGGEQS